MATQAAEMVVVPEPTECAPLRILVAEDDADSAESLALLLRLYGHDVKVARCGPSVLEMAQVQSFDVLLLDIGLPGKNGYEVAKELHDCPPDEEAAAHRHHRLRAG